MGSKTRKFRSHFLEKFSCATLSVSPNHELGTDGTKKWRSFGHVKLFEELLKPLGCTGNVEVNSQSCAESLTFELFSIGHWRALSGENDNCRASFLFAVVQRVNPVGFHCVSVFFER